MTPIPSTSPIVDVLGFLTGAVLYVMLITMVWRERRAEGASFLSAQGRLPLLTGVFGFVWNIGALMAFGPRLVGTDPLNPAMVALAFGALGFLPAAVVHSLFQGGETVVARRVVRPVIWTAYGLSSSAAILHALAAAGGSEVPSRIALWLLTGGFIALTGTLLVVTRRQSVGRRGIWIVALSIFAVSAIHFGSHAGNESWWVELAGHHASLPLALAILYQDYRFAFADLFLKKAIALLLLMAVTLTLFSLVLLPVLDRNIAGGPEDPRAVAVVLGLWMLTGLVFPTLKWLADTFVDRVVLRRPDYAATLSALAVSLERAETEADVVTRLTDSLADTLGAANIVTTADSESTAGPVVLTGAGLRGRSDITTALVRLRTVDAPYYAISLGRLVAGRGLLSDDVRMLDAAATLASRRLDAIRVSQERLDASLREQSIKRLASEAELRALRAQLNPHFLFNALTTIGHLIQTVPSRALSTLLELTHVLRTVLRRSDVELSTFEEEVELLRAYLGIERARFEERLKVEIRVDPQTLGLLCPTLLLQPLVENAVRHGLAPLRSGGTLSIAIDRAADHVLIAIADSGTGFDPGARRAAGLGLANVAQRLDAHFGDRAALNIESRPGHGTTIRLNIPAVASAAAMPPAERKAG